MDYRELKAKLDRIELRQEALIQSIDKLVDIVVSVDHRVAEVLEWAQVPPSNDLPDALQRLASMVSSLQDAIVTFGQQMPGRVADEVAARCR